MLKNLIPLLAAAILFSLVSIFLVNNTKASEQTITCSDGGCSGITGPLFDEANMAPTENVVQTLTVNNNYTQARNFLIQVDGSTFSDAIPSMGDAITIKIAEQESSSIVYGPKTLTELKDDGEISLSNIPAGSQRNYDFRATFKNVGNEYQDMALTFNFTFGFEETVPPLSSGSDSGGEVLGTSTENLVGNVLGLSATGEGSPTGINFLLGALLSTAGVLIIIYYWKKRNEFKIPKIML